MSNFCILKIGSIALVIIVYSGLKIGAISMGTSVDGRNLLKFILIFFRMYVTWYPFVYFFPKCGERHIRTKCIILEHFPYLYRQLHRLEVVLNTDAPNIFFFTNLIIGELLSVHVFLSDRKEYIRCYRSKVSNIEISIYNPVFLSDIDELDHFKSI